MKQRREKEPLLNIRRALAHRRVLDTRARAVLPKFGVALLCTCLLAAVYGAAEVLQGAGFELQGGVVTTGSMVSGGGQYRVEAVLAAADDSNAEFSLGSSAVGAAKNATGCPCQGNQIFADGFESGSLGSWSAVSP